MLQFLQIHIKRIHIARKRCALLKFVESAEFYAETKATAKHKEIFIIPSFCRKSLWLEKYPRGTCNTDFSYKSIKDLNMYVDKQEILRYLNNLWWTLTYILYMCVCNAITGMSLGQTPITCSSLFQTLEKQKLLFFTLTLNLNNLDAGIVLT